MGERAELALLDDTPDLSEAEEGVVRKVGREAGVGVETVDGSTLARTRGWDTEATGGVARVRGIWPVT
jgi:hypothetical protein